MKEAFYLVVGLAVVSGSIFLFLTRPINTEFLIKTVEIEGRVINVEVADDMLEQTRGLSGRTLLGEGNGMLFVYEDPEKQGFWMKDMNFSIDIIWIGEDSSVVWIEKSVSPDTYPKVFHPESPAKYVLEVPAGYSEKISIDIGDSVYFR